MSLFIGRFARPDPLDTQRGFAPALRRTSMATGDRDANPRTRNMRQALGAKFQRHPRLHGQKIKPGADDPYVRCFAHTPRLGAAPHERTNFQNIAHSVPSLPLAALVFGATKLSVA